MELIPTYLSHSYRADDRDVNLKVWDFFWQRGFAFTVDPKSDQASIPNLELMMKRSAAFIAIAPLRKQVRYYRTSPYIVYECGLANQANRPMLILAEQGVAENSFYSANVIPFSRYALDDALARAVADRFKLFERKSIALLEESAFTQKSVGLILPNSAPYRKVRPLIVDALQQAGFDPEPVNLEREDPSRLLSDLRRHDFVITDVRHRTTGPLFPLLYGQCIPTLKLLHHSGEYEVPKLARSRALEQADLTQRQKVVVAWTEPDELFEKLASEISRLQDPRKQFYNREEGEQYFWSLGRKSSGPIFLSNPRESNSLAESISRLLQLRSIETFHYVYNNTLPKGLDFAESLRAKVAHSPYFVPLISREYWESDWCRAEYELAKKEQLVIIPYLLDEPSRDAGLPDVSEQGTSLVGLSPEEQARLIATEVDKILTDDRPYQIVTAQTRPQSNPTMESEQGTIDVVIITVLPEEYSAVIERLSQPKKLRPTLTVQNRYRWTVADVERPGQAPFRVILGITGRKGNLVAQQAAIDSARIFKPRYLLVVGVAGGLQGVDVGDVVVAESIYGYENSKIEDDIIKPRNEWMPAADEGITRAALSVAATSPDWHESLSGRHGRTTPPKVVVGMIASGEKVVDDVKSPAFAPFLKLQPKLVAVEMEGMGAGEAIRTWREEEGAIGFAMIRGISDLPAGSAAADASRQKRSATQTEERDSSKPMAAAAAAEFAFYLMREEWPASARSDRTS